MLENIKREEGIQNFESFVEEKYDTFLEANIFYEFVRLLFLAVREKIVHITNIVQFVQLQTFNIKLKPKPINTLIN